MSTAPSKSWTSSSTIRRRATSRWASGSSSSSTSGACTRQAASATSLRWPPLSARVGRSRSSSVSPRSRRWRMASPPAVSAPRRSIEGGLALEHAAHAVEVGDERRVGELGLDARQLLLEGGGLGPRGGEDLAHGALVAVHHLVQVGDAGAAAQRDRAGVRRAPRRPASSAASTCPRRWRRSGRRAPARPSSRSAPSRISRPPKDFATPRSDSAGAVGAATAMTAGDGSRGGVALARELAVRMTNGCQGALDGSVRTLTGTRPFGRSAGLKQRRSDDTRW